MLNSYHHPLTMNRRQTIKRTPNSSGMDHRTESAEQNDDDAQFLSSFNHEQKTQDCKNKISCKKKNAKQTKKKIYI